jgi:hypothetical protein
LEGLGKGVILSGSSSKRWVIRSTHHVVIDEAHSFKMREIVPHQRVSAAFILS